MESASAFLIRLLPRLLAGAGRSLLVHWPCQYPAGQCFGYVCGRFWAAGGEEEFVSIAAAWPAFKSQSSQPRGCVLRICARAFSHFLFAAAFEIAIAWFFGQYHGQLSGHSSCFFADVTSWRASAFRAATFIFRMAGLGRGVFQSLWYLAKKRPFDLWVFTVRIGIICAEKLL